MNIIGAAGQGIIILQGSQGDIFLQYTSRRRKIENEDALYVRPVV